jgi:hypothetical protein
MKEWFPLTSYDFYAYLTSGMVVLASCDRVFMGSALATESDWKIVIAVFWAAIAYLVGQIVAIPASAIFEHLIAKRILHDPSAVVLGLKSQRWREKCFGLFVGSSEYTPFPLYYRSEIIKKLSHLLKVDENNLEPDTAFQCAFPFARTLPDSVTRLDNFLNQYGLCRNVSFAGLIATMLLSFLAWRTVTRIDIFLAIGSGVLSLGLFVRFVKFYAAYTREVYRAFNRVYEIKS